MTAVLKAGMKVSLWAVLWAASMVLRWDLTWVALMVAAMVDLRDVVWVAHLAARMVAM